jgi:hypothetical protein
MRTRLLLATAALLLMTALPAEAYRDRGDRHAYGYNLKQACDWGNRRACIQLGEIIGQRRQAQRQRYWDRGHYYRPGWNSPPGWNSQPNWPRSHWNQPPYWNRPPSSGFYWRFESR